MRRLLILSDIEAQIRRLLKSFYHRSIFWLTLSGIGTGNFCYAQATTPGDSLEYRAQFEAFDSLIGIENTEIINGRKYKLPLRSPDTHPFYVASTAAPGFLSFNGQPYFNLTLLYDVYSDELIIQWLRDKATLDLLVLDKAKVESFMIYDHRFRNYRGAQAREIGISDGYYDVLFESAAFTLLVRRQKKSDIEMDRLVYAGADRYLFVLPGAHATSFRGMKNFYNVLGNNKELNSQLRAFVSRSKLEIRKSDSDLIATARYCDTLLRKQE